MLKNIYVRLGVVTTIAIFSLLAVLPRIPVTINNKYIKLDSSVGGYYFDIFGKYIVDLREFKEGLDIQGGVRVVLEADLSKVSDLDKDSAIESARQVIERRVNFLGVSEPVITTARVGDSRRIIVEIPGISDVNSAVTIIGQTAQLVFRELKPEKEWDESKYFEYLQDSTAWQDTGVTGADLKGADVTFSQQVGATQGQPEIRMKFTNEGREKFSEVAKKNVNKPIAIYLDQEQAPLSMPVVNADLANGLTDDPVINGNFDVDTANALSVQLRAGALPVPVKVIEQETIGATLGADSVNKSFIAGILGLILVFLFLVYMYGWLGLLSGVALVIYTLVSLALFKLIPVVLTLPGIAGFILSIGMATDANILIFERMKEEVRWGRPRNLALKLGFERAWNSIKDSNISSLITCAILAYFGTGPVRGFAVTLAIGIFVSLFSSIFVTKTLVSIFGGKSNANS